jgi:ubiquinone/menaquinone biosynthesis C-methylase UbiE
MTIDEAMFEFYEDVPVQGPGSKSTTNKLLGLIPKRDAIKNALDIGCGTGRTSLVLAKAGISVTAIDIHRPFLDYLKSKAQKSNLDKNITTYSMSMDNLSLPKKSFDLIWSEASAYSMGFNKALRYWKEFLKPSGYMVVTELCWTSEQRPKELAQFWSQEYPAMSTVNQVKTDIQHNDYDILQTFTLPESDWDNYYNPLKMRIKEYENDLRPEMQEVIDLTSAEINMREKYYKDYNYTAFILKLSGKTN